MIIKNMDQPLAYVRTVLQTRQDGLNYLQQLKDSMSWTREEQVLDIGCGPGNFTLEVLLPFLPPDATLIGCDISKVMIDFAKSSFNHPRLSFKEMDIESTEIWKSWKRESFSKIFSFTVFHWLSKYRECAENMFALLKPGGEVYSMYFAENATLHAFNAVSNSHLWKDLITERVHFSWYSEKSLKERLEQGLPAEMKRAGFEEVDVQLKDCTFPYTTTQHFIRGMMSVDPYRKHIPDSLIAEYDSCFAETMGKLVDEREENGEAVFPYTLIFIRAKKPSPDTIRVYLNKEYLL